MEHIHKSYESATPHSFQEFTNSNKAKILLLRDGFRCRIHGLRKLLMLCTKYHTRECHGHGWNMSTNSWAAFRPKCSFNHRRHLIGSRTVPRKVTNVGRSVERYRWTVTAPLGVHVTVAPTAFTIMPRRTQQLLVTLRATGLSLSNSSFGLLALTGNLGHHVKVPITVGYKSIA